jgi:hypothetical protein
MKTTHLFRSVVAASLCSFISTSAQAEKIFGLEANNTLFVFDSKNTSITTTIGVLSGIPVGHSIVGMDNGGPTEILHVMSFNPTTLTGNLFTLDPRNAVLKVVGSSFSLSAVSKNNEWGFDFDPTTYRIRVVSGDGQNFRIDPFTGTIVGTDTSISSGQDVDLTGIAYDRNDTNFATPSTLFAYDFRSDRLGRIGGIDGTPSPNGGVFTPLGGPSGIAAGTSDLDLDISMTGTGYAVVRTEFGNRSSLYTFNTTTGVFTRLGDFPNRTVSDLAVGSPWTPPYVRPQVGLQAKPASFGDVAKFGSLAKDGKLILTAKPKKGREFIGWFEKGNRISKKSKLTIFSLNGNRLLTARFK